MIKQFYNLFGSNRTIVNSLCKDQQNSNSRLFLLYWVMIYYVPNNQIRQILLIKLDPDQQGYF